MKPLRSTLIALLLVVAGVSLVFILRPVPPAVIVMPLPDAFPTHKASLLDRCKRAIPLWAWRVIDSVRGPRQAITIDTAVFDLTGQFGSVLWSLSLGTPAYADTNGFQVWILGNDELRTLRGRIEKTSGQTLVSAPRVTTAHGIQSQMSVHSAVTLNGVPSNVGVVLDLLPRIRREVADLTTMMTVTEVVTNLSAATAGSPQTNVVSIQTNIAVAARIQIPKRKSVFLLSGERSGLNAKRTGVMISPTFWAEAQ